MPWDFFTLADQLHDALSRREAALRLEQAVYGLDSLSEVELHALLEGALAPHYTVAREVVYPAPSGRRRKSARLRCDLVLTPLGLPLHDPDVPPGLFAAPSCPPGDALWLEVKAAWQFRDVATRHGGYGAQWRTAVVDDLRKMEAEAAVRDAGLLLVVFNESDAVLAKDLELFEDHLALKEVLAGFRQVRSVPILERMGHRLATVALWPTVQR